MTRDPSQAETEAQVHAIVLDTSVFTNPDTAAAFGDRAATALRAFVDMARRVTREVRFYMPPSILEELQTFVDPGELPDDFDYVIQLRAPRRYDVKVSGSLLYELIDDVRGRINRGLRVAEEAVRNTRGQEPDKIITRLREKYRAALRAGFIDSREDVDVVLLAMELEAAVVSSDRGLVTWAEKLGLRIIRPERLHGILQTLIEPPRTAD